MSIRSLARIPTTFSAFVLLTCLALPVALSGHDQGLFEVSQPGNTDPVAWVWCDDSTDDGDGVEYVAMLSSYEHCNASNTSQESTVDRVSSTGFSSPEDFADWLVSNYSHVGSRTDLTIHKRVVTPVVLLP